MTSSADRPDSAPDEPPRQDSDQEVEPDTTRLGFRDTDEQQAYDEEDEQADEHT